MAPILAGFIITAAAAILAAQTSLAEPLYRFVDENSVIQFSDAPTDARFTKVSTLDDRTRKIEKGNPFLKEIYAASVAYGVNHALIMAVIKEESGFSAGATSVKGAMGLMQLMPETAGELGVLRPLRAHENLDGGVRHLKILLDRYGDVRRALAAYNAGASAVDRYSGIPPYPETEAYVKRVLNYYRGYRDDFGR